MHLSQPHQGTKIKFTTTTLYGASNVTPYNGGENIRQINPAYTIVKIINNIESLTINLKKASFALSNVFFFLVVHVVFSVKFINLCTILVSHTLHADIPGRLPLYFKISAVMVPLIYSWLFFTLDPYVTLGWVYHVGGTLWPHT